jgi:hypothetical protein
MPKNRFLKLCCVRTDGYDDTDEEMEQLQRKLEDEHRAKNPPPVIVDTPAPEINPKLLSREESQKVAPKTEEKETATKIEEKVTEQPQVTELNQAPKVDKELVVHTTQDQRETSVSSNVVPTQTGMLETTKNESNQPKTAQTSQLTKPSETISNVRQPDNLPQATLPQKTEAPSQKHVETNQQSNKSPEPLRTQPSIEDKWSKLIKARAQGEDLSEDTLERELKKTSPKQNQPPQQTQPQPVERKPRDELDEKWSRIVSKRAQGVDLSEGDL